MFGCKAKKGFTLLELMIALGLLGALMAVAWALLGTFRDAEMRGWRLSFRTQTIRSARAWLENDLQHLVHVAVSKKPAGTTRAKSAANAIDTPQTSNATFHGTAMGFTTTISPSIDPIPFLGNLMSDVQESSLTEPSDALNGNILKLDEALGNAKQSPSPWPADSVDIEYELVPMATSLSSQTSALPGNVDSQLDKTQYSLVRREQISTGDNAAFQAPSERSLNALDLYRQSDESVVAIASPMSEMRLDGLLHPQFRYFDGMAWVNQWNSSQRGGLPRAIAFGFDFPSASEIQHPSERESEEQTEDVPLAENQLTTADSLLDTLEQEQETIQDRASGGNQGIMIFSTHEVQLVIFIAAGVQSGGRP